MKGFEANGFRLSSPAEKIECEHSYKQSKMENTEYDRIPSLNQIPSKASTNLF